MPQQFRSRVICKPFDYLLQTSRALQVTQGSVPPFQWPPKYLYQDPRRMLTCNSQTPSWGRSYAWAARYAHTYKSDMMSLKASGLHWIATRPEVFPCKDLVATTMNFCVLERGLLASRARTLAIITGSVFQDLYKMPQPDLVYDAESAKAFLKGRDLVKGVLRDWAKDPDTFKRKTHIDYPVSHFGRGIRIGMVLLNRLWGMANTNHVNQHWVLLLGEIIINDKKPDFAEVLAYTLHQNWEITQGGKSFFMASYEVDACYAFLSFGHPQFPEWPHSSGGPIHVLFDALYIYKYQQHMATICNHFYPVVYRAIHGIEMPRLSGHVRNDLSNLGAWWFFEDFTIIRVEGLRGGKEMQARHPKAIPAPPILHREHVLSELAIPREGREGVEGMNLPHRDPKRQWDPFSEVQQHLAAIHDKRIQAARDARPPEEDAEETDEVLARRLLGGLPTRKIVVQPPIETTATPSTSSIIPPPHVIRQTSTTSRASPSASTSKTTSIVQALDVATPPVVSLSVESPVTISINTAPSAPSQLFTPDTTTSLNTTLQGASPSPLPPRPSKQQPSFPQHHPHLPLPGPFKSTLLKPPIWRSLASTIATGTPGISLTAPLSTQHGGMPVMHPIDLAKAEKVGSTPPKAPEVTLEYDKVTSILKKVTRRKVKTGGQVTTIQTEENLLSLTRKRKRKARGTGMEDEELIANPISIVTSANKVDEWGSKLATLENVARRNLMPNLSLLELDEVVTCENILAKTKQALEDGGAPLMASNKQLEPSAHNIKVLLDSVGLPLVVKPDSSFPAKAELDASLGEFANQFARQLESVEEQVAAKIKEPVINTSRIDSDYDRCEVTPDTRHQANLIGGTFGLQPAGTTFPHYVARWEVYLMAKEMTSRLPPDSHRHPPEDEASSMRPAPEKLNKDGHDPPRLPAWSFSVPLPSESEDSPPVA
eukprot:Gb_09493 [translate_table: standard]